MTSPASLLARLDELKKWQKQQQERLMRNHNRRLEETEKNFSMASDYETIAGLSEFDSTLKTPDKPTKSIFVPKPSPFVQDPANKSSCDSGNSNLNEGTTFKNSNNVMNGFSEDVLFKGTKDLVNNTAKPKKTYLKKGSGLVRYNMNPGDQYRPFTKSTIQKSSMKTVKAVNMANGCQNNVNKKSKENTKRKTVSWENPASSNSEVDKLKNITPLKKPPLKVSPQAVWQKVCIDSNDSNDPELKSVTEAINTRYHMNFKKNDTDIYQLLDKEETKFNEKEIELVPQRNILDKECSEQEGIPIQPNISPKEDFVIKRPSMPMKPSVLGQNILAQINEFAAKRFGPRIQNSPPKEETPQRIDDEAKHQEDKSEINTPGEQTMYEKALEKELLIFEALERKAMNSSFGSTNSSIVRLLSSTPQKQNKRRSKLHSESDIEMIEESEAENNEQEQKKNKFDDTRQDFFKNLTMGEENNNQINQEVRCENDTVEKYYKHKEDSLKQRDLYPEVTIINTTKRSSYDDSCNSSVTSEDLIDDDPMHSNKDFKDSEKWSDTNTNTTETSSAETSIDYTSCENVDETLKPQIVKHTSVQTSRQNSFQESNLRNKVRNNKNQTSRSSSSEKESKTRRSSIPDTHEDLLPLKLRELDIEIDNFRKENANIINLRRELEEQQRELKREMKRLEKEADDEKLRIEFYLEEEKKKLAKEKMVFERYVKDLQNKPTKKERDEISSLKMEVANLKETLKLKETRNGTTQARLRNQVKSLEKENANLRDEVDKLNKLNAKLIASQKLTRRPSDTKMLHEINKNLTKLTKDAKVNNNIKKVEKNVTKSKSQIKIFSDNESSSSSEEKEDSNDSLEDNFEQIQTQAKANKQKSFNATFKETPKSNKKRLEPEDEIIEEQNNSFSKERSKLNVGNEESRRTHSGSRLSELDLNKTTKDSSYKENDKNMSNTDCSSFRNLTDLSLVRNYEKMFGNFEEPQRLSNSSLNDSQKKDRIERVLPDGSKEIKYANGNLKTVSQDGNFIVMKYFNGDMKETKLLEGIIKYYYMENSTWHTTYADGTELLEFPNGQIEKRYNDGSCEIQFPNGIIKRTTDGAETVTYPDGTVVTINSEGDKILHLPNGQKEIHTKEHKRREYPDGTVKILYPDGMSETRYSNGRIRMKDKNGELIMDTYDTNS